MAWLLEKVKSFLYSIYQSMDALKRMMCNFIPKKKKKKMNVSQSLQAAIPIVVLRVSKPAIS